MSQCRPGKRWLEISCIVCLAAVLAACSMAELERFALENDQPTGTTGGAGATAIDPTQLLVPDHVIKGGKQEMQGALGQFARILVGEDDEVRFLKPVSVGGYENFLYIVDGDARVVFQYNLVTKTIRPIGDVGVQFQGEPGNIYVARDLSFYIVDSEGKRAFHFDEKGKLLNTFADAANLSRPIDVFVDEVKGEVWIADGSYSHFVVFDRFGNPQRIVGRRGTGPGRFRAITDSSMGPDGIYVLDRLELPVQVITEDGVYRYHFGEAQQIYPIAIAVNQDQYVFVADKSDNMIRVYQHGNLLATVGGGGSGPGRFRIITGLWVKDNLLYVADSLNRRVQVLRLAGQASTSPATPATLPSLDL